MVFQDPYGSLDPSRTVGRSVTEPLETIGRLAPEQTAAEARRLLDAVRLPQDSASRYPHALSGGQRQRVGIARALSTGPRLVICDEAVSALDVNTQAQVLNLLADIQRETGVAYLFIAHNLPLVAYLADRVVVLYRGRVMEAGPAAEVHEMPLHPYTRALVAAVPVADPVQQRRRRLARAKTLRSDPARGDRAPAEGCPFAPRCPQAAEVCWSFRPRHVAAQDRSLACHAYDPDSGHPGPADVGI